MPIHHTRVEPCQSCTCPSTTHKLSHASHILALRVSTVVTVTPSYNRTIGLQSGTCIRTTTHLGHTSHIFVVIDCCIPTMRTETPGNRSQWRLCHYKGRFDKKSGAHKACCFKYGCHSSP